MNCLDDCCNDILAYMKQARGSVPLFMITEAFQGGYSLDEVTEGMAVLESAGICRMTGSTGKFWGLTPCAVNLDAGDAAPTARKFNARGDSVRTHKGQRVLGDGGKDPIVEPGDEDPQKQKGK